MYLAAHESGKKFKETSKKFEFSYNTVCKIVAFTLKADGKMLHEWSNKSPLVLQAVADSG